MKNLLIIILAVIVIYSCNNKSQQTTIVIHDTVLIPETHDQNAVNDRTGNTTLLQGINIGDTVIVETLMNGQQMGILKAEYQGHYWVDFFNCPDEKGWRTDYPGIMPYNKKWEVLLTPHK